MASGVTFTFLINAAQTESLAQAAALLEQEAGPVVRVKAFAVSDLEEERLSPEAVRQALGEADVVFLDIRGGGRAAGLAAATLARTRQPVLVLVGGSPELLRLVRLGSFSLGDILARRETRPAGGSPPSVQRIQQLMRLVETGGSLLPWGRLRHARNWARAVRYWLHGGPENLKNLLLFVAREYTPLKLPKPAPPREYPEYGLYDLFQGQYYRDLRAYARAAGLDPAKPTVGLLFYGGMHFAQSLVPATALARELTERHGLQVLPVFATAGHNLAAIREFFLFDNRPQVDALVYFQWFQLTTFSDEDPGEASQLLAALNVPVFNAAPLYGRDIASWRESDQGLSPVEVLTTVILPELDGMIEPLPTAGLEEAAAPSLGGPVRRVAPIPDRVARLAHRIAAWIRLRRTPPAERRVAFLLYNTPPGEDNLGSAAYLDTFASLERLLAALKEAGYRVGEIPAAGRFPELFLSRGLVNDPRWLGESRGQEGPVALRREEYETLVSRLPGAAELVRTWGEPPGGIMVAHGRLLIPVLQSGHILVGVQPVRGYHADPAKISHDRSLPPHHQYVAFYRWLEEVWQPHAVVHVGTHGTLEFLPGKEVGISSDCWPEALLGNLPHLYLYHVVNASEAVIAKRRSLGVLVNYTSPAFTTSGLYEDYAALDELLGEYYEALTLDPGRAPRLEARIRERARELHLPGGTVAEIQEELTRMQRSIIPKGLHILGEEPTVQERLEYAALLCRYDRGEAPSLMRLLAARRGLDYHELVKNPRSSGAGELAAVEAEARELLARAMQRGEFPSDPELTRGVRYALEAAARMGGRREITALLAGLAGGYVPPGLGGDPVRTPEVLPTGRNSYQFDPRSIPSEESCRRGREIAENTLRHYHRRHGRYPASTAVILWGFETTKTRGETVGQVLAYLGVEVESQANPWYKKLKPIPLFELGRPRVDCLVQICGFFRDMFPNVLDLLHRAFELVSELEEPEEMNPVRSHTRSLRESLAGRVPAERLPKLAMGRIFGPRPGEYGTRTTHLIETGAWQREEEIARLFMDNMAHLYAPNVPGEAVPEAYRARLAEVELVSQVRDSHEYEIADLDHYYEFFGGLALSVESVRGQRPEMLISDSTKESILTETVAEAINRGVRTRLLNPRWIEELLEHHFHGAQKISDRVEYLLGLAATTHAVENWVFSAVTERYVLDEAMFARLADNNRFAAEALLKRLAEAASRGYWQATEAELQALRERYLALEGLIEEKLE